VQLNFGVRETGIDVMNSAIVSKPLTAADRGRLEILCRECTDFFELVEGQPGGSETAAEILGPLPSNVTFGAKSIFGLERGNELIGAVELLAGFPLPNEWYVGLLLLRPDARGAGVGTIVWEDLRKRMNMERAVGARLIVHKQNSGARRFWERQGFAVEKEIVAKVGKLQSQAWQLRLTFEAATQLGVAPDDRSPSAPARR
jgi:ribosomal protein S18 acetylase RimI-like enzyme